MMVRALSVARRASLLSLLAGRGRACSTSWMAVAPFAWILHRRAAPKSWLLCLVWSHDLRMSSVMSSSVVALNADRVPLASMSSMSSHLEVKVLTLKSISLASISYRKRTFCRVAVCRMSFPQMSAIRGWPSVVTRNPSVASPSLLTCNRRWARRPCDVELSPAAKIR